MWKHQASQIILITFISSFSTQVLQIYLCHMIKSLLGNIHWLWLSWGHQGSRAWWRPLHSSALTCCWSRTRSGSVCADLARKQNKNIFPNSLHLPRVCFWTVFCHVKQEPCEYLWSCAPPLFCCSPSPSHSEACLWPELRPGNLCIWKK